MLYTREKTCSYVSGHSSIVGNSCNFGTLICLFGRLGCPSRAEEEAPKTSAVLLPSFDIEPLRIRAGATSTTTTTTWAVMQCSLPPEKIFELTTERTLPDEDAAIVRSKLQQAGIPVESYSPRVVARGAIYKLVSEEAFFALAPAVQSSAIAVQSKPCGPPYVAVRTSWSSKNASLSFGDFSLDAMSSTKLLVTRAIKHSTASAALKQVATIEFDTSEQLEACFALLNPCTPIPPPKLPVSSACEFSNGAGACVPPVFTNFLGIYLEHGLRLHTLLTARAGAPRRVMLEACFVVDIEASARRRARHLVTAKLHGCSGRCLCGGPEKDGLEIALNIEMCGGDFSSSGLCSLCEGIDSTDGNAVRCQRLGLVTLVCRHDSKAVVNGVQKKRVPKTRHALAFDPFLSQFATAMVDLRHSSDLKKAILTHDRLKALLDEALDERRARAQVTPEQAMIYDEWAVAMLESSEFYCKIQGSLTKRGGGMRTWQKDIASSYWHLFPQ